jgi:hypothetical protein
LSGIRLELSGDALQLFKEPKLLKADTLRFLKGRAQQSAAAQRIAPLRNAPQRKRQRLRNETITAIKIPNGPLTFL